MQRAFICPPKGAPTSVAWGREWRPPCGLHDSERLLKDSEPGPTPSDNEQESRPLLEGSWRCHGTGARSHSRSAHQGQSLRAAFLCSPGHCAMRAGEAAQGLSVCESWQPEQPQKANPGQRRGPKESLINNYTLSLHSTSFFPDELEVFWRHYFTRAFRFFI